MNNLNYYKTLISDEEVIKALVRESKAREGELEKTRVRPNMNFFQRTVTNMISSNKRISSKQEKKVAEEKEKNKLYRPKKIISKKRSARELINEILTSQTKFVRSSNAESVHFVQELDDLTEIRAISGCTTLQNTKLDHTQIDLSLLKCSIDNHIHLNKYNEDHCIPISKIDTPDQPIQISSDEAHSDVHNQIDYSYKKKKCKRKHKSKKRSKS